MPSAKSASLSTALPTRAEFGRRLSADRRRFYWAIGLCCVSLLLVFAGMPLIVERMNRAGVPPGSTDRVLPLFALFPVPLAILFGGIWWADRKSQTKCPACRQSLFTAHDPYVAMVTGRCPKCAAPMFADDVHTIDARQSNRQPPLTTLGALRDMKELLRQFRPAIPWVIAGAVLLGLGNRAEQLLETEYDSSLSGAAWTEFLKRAWFVPGAFVGSLGLWASVRALRAKTEPCPACGEMIDGWSRRTGNCSTCGRPVVPDPFPGLQPRDAVASRLWSINEYHTAARRRRSRQWIGCLIGSGLALVWCTPLFLYLSQQPQYYVQSVREMVAYVVTIFGIGVMQCVGVWWWDRRLARGLQCPACNHELLHFHPLVVSSQRCCHCGCQVLQPPGSQSAA